jgi:hypothetical protein
MYLRDLAMPDQISEQPGVAPKTSFSIAESLRFITYRSGAYGVPEV